MTTTKLTANQLKSKVTRILTKNGFQKSTRTGRAGSTTLSSYSKGYDIDTVWDNTRIRTATSKEATAIATVIEAAGYTVRTDFTANYNEVVVLN